MENLGLIKQIVFLANKYRLLFPLAILFVGIQRFMLTKLYLVPNQWLPTIKFAGTLISILFTVNFFMCIADSNYLAEKPSKLLSLIGTSSMVIYLLHVITGNSTRIILRHFLGISNFYVHLVFGCLAGIIGSILLVKIFTQLGFSFLFVIPNRLSVEQKYAKLL